MYQKQDGHQPMQVCLAREKKKRRGEEHQHHVVYLLVTIFGFLHQRNLQRKGTSPFSPLNPLFPSLPPSPNHPSTAWYKRLNNTHSKLCLLLSKKGLPIKMSLRYTIFSLTTNIRCKESLIANINWGYQKGHPKQYQEVWLLLFSMQYSNLWPHLLPSWVK